MSDLEPWLRGTLGDVPAVQRAVLHALELGREDLALWLDQLTDGELHVHLPGVASIAFHLRHIARSLDRLLTYAEGRQLTESKLADLGTESDPKGNQEELWAELASALDSAASRIRALDPKALELRRVVGRGQLPTTLGGLLVHIADHTQRHVGQVITSAKIVVAQRKPVARG